MELIRGLYATGLLDFNAMGAFGCHREFIGSLGQLRLLSEE
jgi:hypothetical protein